MSAQLEVREIAVFSSRQKFKKYLCIRVQEKLSLTTRYSTSKRRQACPFTHGKTHTSPVSISFLYRHLLDFF